MIDRLAAVSIGSAVPPSDFKAAVHSVFRHAVNLRPADDALLLTLLFSAAGDLPQGVRLGGDGMPPGGGLVPGAACSRRGDVLTIGDSLIVELGHARRWDADLSSLAVDMTDVAVAAAWRHAWEALRLRQMRQASSAPPVGSPCQGRTVPSLLQFQIDCAFHDVLGATTAFDLPGAARIGDLVGLGIGLTPSGDDLLTGYLAGLWCTVRGEPRRRDFLRQVSDLVIQWSPRTNDIARTYLCLAARGLVSSQVLDLAAAISAASDRAIVRTCAEAALQVGHSSGMETVRGLLLGLAAWDASHLLT